MLISSVNYEFIVNYFSKYLYPSKERHYLFHFTIFSQYRLYITLNIIYYFAVFLLGIFLEAIFDCQFCFYLSHFCMLVVSFLVISTICGLVSCSQFNLILSKTVSNSFMRGLIQCSLFVRFIHSVGYSKFLVLLIVRET